MAPDQGEYAERLSGTQVATILAGLRQRHDVVVVDAGAVVTEASAAAVELADEVYVVTTPDVPALRGTRRLVELWERLALRKEEAVHAIINRTDKRSDIQPETAARIAGVEVTRTRLPAAFRALEAANNQRDPELAGGAWAAAHPRAGDRAAARHGPPAQRTQRARARSASGPRGGRHRGGDHGSRRGSAHHPPARRGRRRDGGQATIELVGLFPLLLLILLFIWQAVLMGVGAHYAANSAQEGARAAAVGGDVSAAARAAVPASFAANMRVRTSPDDGTVTVTINPPLFLPGARPLDVDLSASSPAGERAMSRRLLPRRGRRRDGGWLSLELVGMSFFLFLAALMVAQVAAATYTIAQANGAARAAARAATLKARGRRRRGGPRGRERAPCATAWWPPVAARATASGGA